MDLTAETHVLGWGSESITFPVPDGPMRVADLITARAAAEWNATGQMGIESLPPEDIRTDARPESPRSAREAGFAALDAYRAGWYIILVDGVPTTGTDETVRLTSRSAVKFVRVYPLPGARTG